MNTGFPLLSVLTFMPLLGAVAVMSVSKRRPEAVRTVALISSLATLGLAIGMLVQFSGRSGGYEFVETHTWSTQLGLSYHLGVDGISVFLVVLTALLFPLGFIASASVNERLKSYCAWMLILETGILGVFSSLDLIMFFFFFEIVLIPMYMIIGGWGHGNRTKAATKFFIYTMAGSAFLLTAILTIAVLHQRSTGTMTFELQTLAAWAPHGLSGPMATVLFLGFFIAFAIKIPLVPLHTWLPDAHTEAPTMGSVILAGVLLKMGTYGLIRLSLGLFPKAAHELAPLLFVLAVVGIIYGAIVATMQKDLKRLIAYSSVAHLGFVVLGIAAFNVSGMSGAVFTMVSHGLTTGALFLLVGFIYDRRHTREIAAFRGIWKATPVLGGLFLIAVFASIGLPGFSGFIGEFMSLLGAFQANRIYAIIGAVGVILAAVYLLWAFQRAFTGEPREEDMAMEEIRPFELLAVLPLLGLSLFMGLYPKPFIDRVEPSVCAVVATAYGHVSDHSAQHSASDPRAYSCRRTETMAESGSHTGATQVVKP